MKQLTALDATFLHLESEAMPMHVGALHVFELPAGFRGRFATRLRQHLAARLPLAPVLRRRLWVMPLNLANPAWVDADPDLKYHVSAHRLPAGAAQGSGLAALQQAVGELHGQLLDRDRPLWRMHVLEGLAPAASGRGRVGLFTQFHHAAVDGQAAVALAQVILDLRPDAPAPALRPSQRDKVFALGAVAMLRGAIAQEAQQLVRLVRELPDTAGTLVGAAGQALQLGLDWRPKADAVSNLTLAPRTPFNVNVQAGRQFAALTLPLAVLKAAAKAHEATLNDLVLYLCSTGLRRYLAHHGGVPRKSLVAAVPISLRAPGDPSANTQASMSLISLGSHVADPRKRLAHIKIASAAMKATMGQLRSVLPIDLPSIGLPWLSQALAGLYGKARLAERVPPLANVVISNVPGPPVPLYLVGARMLSNYPASIVTHGLALNITVQSYDQSLDLGLVADAHAAPNLQALADAIESAYFDLPLLVPARERMQSEAGSLPALARSGQRLLGDAQKQLVSKVTGAVTGAVSGAVGGLVSGVVRQAVQGAVGGAVGGVVGGAARGVAGRARAAKPSPKMAAAVPAKAGRAAPRAANTGARSKAVRTR